MATTEGAWARATKLAGLGVIARIIQLFAAHDSERVVHGKTTAEKARPTMVGLRIDKAFQPQPAPRATMERSK